MGERAVHHMEIALRRPHWLERRLDAKAPERNGRRARGCLGALIVGLAAMSSIPSMGHAPSLQECFEGGDFIANAAQARDNGMPKSVFIDRLVADVYTIQAFPPELRWFVVDPQDAEFLMAEASQVFDRPVPPEAHRADFLSRCFDR
jgi:hypothetical protein